jgi:hypothetical protein
MASVHQTILTAFQQRYHWQSASTMVVSSVVVVRPRRPVQRVRGVRERRAAAATNVRLPGVVEADAD